MYTAGAALLAENDHWQLARHGKRLIAQTLETQSKLP